MTTIDSFHTKLNAIGCAPDDHIETLFVISAFPNWERLQDNVFGSGLGGSRSIKLNNIMASVNKEKLSKKKWGEILSILDGSKLGKLTVNDTASFVEKYSCLKKFVNAIESMDKTKTFKTTKTPLEVTKMYIAATNPRFEKLWGELDVKGLRYDALKAIKLFSSNYSFTDDDAKSISSLLHDSLLL